MIYINLQATFLNFNVRLLLTYCRIGVELGAGGLDHVLILKHCGELAALSGSAENTGSRSKHFFLFSK